MPLKIMTILGTRPEIIRLSLIINKLEPIRIKTSDTHVITTKAKYFVYDDLNIIINYEDENGNPFTLEKTIEIRVINLPWYIKIIKFFKNLF